MMRYASGTYSLPSACIKYDWLSTSQEMPLGPVGGSVREAPEKRLKDWGGEGVRFVKTKEGVEEGLVEELARATA